MPSLIGKKNRTALFVDVGDSAVKYLLLGPQDAKNKQKVLASGSQDADKFSWEKRIHEIMEMLQKRFSIGTFILSVSPTIFRARVFDYHFSRENPSRPIDRNEEKKIGNEIIRASKEDVSSYLSTEYGMPPEELVVPKIKIVKATINEYPVSSLRGFQGASIVVRVLGTCLPIEYRKLLERFQKTHKVKEAKLVHWAEGVEAFGADRERDGVYFDIGDQVTQIAVVKNGELTAATMVRAGVDNIVYQIEDQLGLHGKMAQDYISRYAKGEFSSDLRTKMGEIFLREIKKWGEACEKKLMDFQSVLPSTIFLMGGGSTIPQFGELFEEGKGFEDTSFNGSLSTFQLLPDHIIQLAGFSAANRDAKYTPLILLAYGEQKKNP